MTGTMKLTANQDGTYDIIMQYNNSDAEFALDFFSKENLKSNYQNLSEFVTAHSKNIKIASIRVMVGSLLVATISLTSFLNVFAGSNKYSMAYLYSGTVQDQLNYVARTNNSLQTVSPSYFDINYDGSLKLNPVSQELVNQMHANNIKVVPFLSNHWDQTAGVNALRDVETLSTQIAGYIEQYNLDGVNVDIENVTGLQRSQYTELVRLLRAKIPAQKEVSVAVASNPNGWDTGWYASYDYTALAQYSDYLMVMTYDEHYEGSPAGPVASIGFVERSIQYALSKTTADKIVVGLPLYGRIWSLDDNSFIGKGVPIAAVNNMITDYNAVVTYDTDSQSPKAEFTVKSGDKQYSVVGKTLAPGRYIIWYENNQSFQAKLNLVQKYDVKGAGSWALGQEDTSLWQNYSTWLNGTTTAPTTPPNTGNNAVTPSAPAAVTPSAPAPTPVASSPAANVGTPAAVNTPGSQQIIYTVKPKDNLAILAQLYGTTVDSIKALNNLDNDLIHIGWELKIQTNTVNSSGDPAIAAHEVAGWVTARTRTLNIRADANLKSAIIARLRGSAPLVITGAPANGFYPVRLQNGQTGFASAKYITTINPAASKGVRK